VSAGRKAPATRRRPKASDVAAAVEAARRARTNAHSPYSGYRVGAAILTRTGGVYAGCNVENASFGATLCAERSAVAGMVSAGDRDPVACVVVTAGPRPATPCGICRQVLSEFARDLELVLVAEDDSGRIVRRTSARLAVLLPQVFRLDST
jgi:cytidine deaminase